MKIAVIGGGAAGFFAAINAKENHPTAEVTLFEKSEKTLTKVKISGGGRCNVTNAATDIDDLISAYPRGGKALKKCFSVFSTQDTRAWFEARGVPLVVEADQRVFPESQQSQTIVNCFWGEIEKHGIDVKQGVEIRTLEPAGEQIKVTTGGKNPISHLLDKVIVATGGSPKLAGLIWLEKLGHKIETPTPSLFTFNMPTETITSLPGVAVDQVLVSIQGSRLKSSGPILITHWGLSGPAILKLSAFGARELFEKDYRFKIQINWTHRTDQAEIMSEVEQLCQDHPKKKLVNINPYGLPERLWRFLLARGGFTESSRWQELGKKALNRLVNLLSNDVYEIQGKTTFKEEFVTCGGVSLASINLKTMESKACKNLYFAGEVMDIDGITGGYNFQAAWTTAYIAARLD